MTNLGNKDRPQVDVTSLTSMARLRDGRIRGSFVEDMCIHLKRRACIIWDKCKMM